ncbi:TetR/AcrR family transcriptional regulator [Nannocystaceae bacterium ST9]
MAAKDGLATAGTRERLIAAAERLFAEQGMSVSNRQIGEAAGQANNSVISYHFGTKADLVLAIVRSHAPDIEVRRLKLLAGLAAPVDLGAWLRIVVEPITAHLDALGTPSWYARFIAQASSNPTLGPLLYAETLAAPSMRAPFEGVQQFLGGLPDEVFEERTNMTRYVVVNTCAERERALDLGLATPRASWADAARGMVDALVGLWNAPITTVESAGTRTRRARVTKAGT